MSSDDLFDEVQGSMMESLSPPSLGSTPIDCSGVVGTAATVVANPSENKGKKKDHLCLECGKTLQTRSGFTRHIALHKLNHDNSRKPLEDEIRAALPEILKKIVHEMKEEPSVSVMGADKKEFVMGLSSSLESAEMCVLVNTLAKPIIECVLVRVKVMPSAQYEKALMKVHAILKNSDFCEDVKKKLMLCVPEELRNKSDRVLLRLVWRLTTKFLENIQEAVFRHMKEKHQAACDAYVMQDREVECFKEHISKILRAVYKFGAASKNSTWNLRCKSMRERFVNSQKPLNDHQFLNLKMWEENFITLSDAALKIFLGIGRIIQTLQSAGSACNADIVFQSLLNVENIILLNSIRDLSSGIMCEELALSFVQDLIKNLTALSGKLETSRQFQKASKKYKTTTVSLRTNLKRNPVTGLEEV